jgi:6-phosphofructokinase 2
MSQEKHQATESINTVAVLALNPAVDISYEIAQLMADQKVRATKTYYHPGGNGINVARSLVELGIPVRCCSVLGGKSGELLLRLLGDGLRESHHYIEVDGETRINVTLQQKQPPSQYEVDSGGPEIPEEILERIIDCFLDNANSGVAVLSGSTPPGVPESTYAELIEEISGRGGKVMLDAHGKVLQMALEANPYLLRTNRYVLEHLIKKKLNSVEEVAEAARDIQRRGTPYVCISLGREGAVLLDDNRSYHCNSPRVRVISTVGGGDAMLAGILSALLKNQSTVEMLRFGVICGSATASHPGTELFNRDEIEEKEYELTITALDI